MSWGVDDWELWSSWTPTERGRSRSVQDWVADLLRRLPDLERRRLADLGSSLSATLPATAARFAEVVAVDRPGVLRTRTPATRDGLGLPHGGCSLAQLANGGRRYDAAVAIDSWCEAGRADLDLVLRSTWCGLTEGGIVLVSVPARRDRRRPFTMALGAADGDEPGRYHELELQYLMSRAGYQGVRIRELGEGVDRALVAMAVRRALN